MLVWFVAAGLLLAQQTPPSADPVEKLIESYFAASVADEREKLARKIETESGGSVERVAKAVRDAKPWDRPVPEAPLAITTRSAGTVNAYWKSPQHAGAGPYGLVLVLSGVDQAEPHAVALERAAIALGPEFGSSCYLAFLAKPLAATFHQHPAAGDDLGEAIRILRRALGARSDRVFLFGHGAGGAAVWNATVFHGELFAGAVVSASRPQWPYPEQLAPLLLTNLRNLPILSIWESDAAEKPADEVLANAVYNRAIVQLAQQTALPITGAERPFRDTAVGHLAAMDSVVGDLAKLAASVRASPGRAVSRWFRYASQGDLGWVRATKLHGDVWTDDQLSIVPAAHADRSEFITGFFKEKLFRLSGEVDGQTITLETKGIAKLEVLFFEGMMDYTQPVTIVCNGRMRFSGLIKPHIATLLEHAYQNWEFQRFVLATTSFSIRPDGAGE